MDYLKPLSPTAS